MKESHSFAVYVISFVPDVMRFPFADGISVKYQARPFNQSIASKCLFYHHTCLIADAFQRMHIRHFDTKKIARSNWSPLTGWYYEPHSKFQDAMMSLEVA